MPKNPETEEEQRRLVKEDPDYVMLSRYQHSLKKLCDRYPDGVPEHIASSAVGLTETEYGIDYSLVVQKIREGMGVE